MCTDTCNQCKYYRQHYSFDDRKIFRVYCGHCTCQKVKTKRPDAKICENYLPAESKEAAFVSKEFLSKELLDYFLRMELLPEIQDIEKGSHSGSL